MKQDWIEGYFNTKWIRFYNSSARDFFYHTEVDEEEASQEAQEHLLVQLQKMDEQPSEPLVRTIFKNALRDLYRKHFGRYRPPGWIQKLGATWIQVWQWFCLQSMPLLEIQRSLLIDQQQKAEKLVEQIKQTDGCPQKRSRAVSMQDPIKGDEEDGDQLGDFINDGVDQVHEELDQGQLNQLVKTLFSMENQDDQLNESWLVGILDNRHKISDKLKLSHDEILILKMRFEEDESIKNIAEALFKPDYQIRRDLKKALNKMRQILQELNLNEYHLMS